MLKFVMIFCLIGVVTLWKTYFNDKNTHVFYKPFICKKLQTGDIVFRKENNIISDIFAQIDHSNYSHVGIVLKQDNKCSIYHMEYDEKSEDLKIVSLKDFLFQASQVQFYRYKNFSIKKKKSLSDLLFSLDPKKLSFDFDFDLDNRKFYCTEFVNFLFFHTVKKNIYTYLYDFHGKKVITVKSILLNKKDFLAFESHSL